ncbi:PEP/pyruvate-binding domain-containing protein [Microbacterium sp. MPKO10]|uniref:PEP/pyruvate-binding domain-containing protein n=1 Tax=Microbacterium sp. MPKO10 TaxID=2989818 RepID=UPI002235670F|nr:PEP/pyruvate-binding domain-containing protein [Microbacterium sp. MPKO10]MCW4459172.1 PEP-utilizing enzyme [Microbacterium sp. MPKO10]
MATAGAKAAALGTMLRAGLPVPEGFVLSTAAEHPADGPISEEQRRDVERAYARMGSPVVAVRSSASSEDSAHESEAGAYESILGVSGMDALLAAIQRCRLSLHSERARASRLTAGAADTTEHPTMAVIVQRMVHAEASGVLFTPATLDGAALIESSWGLGPSVVEGRVVPDRFRIDGDGTFHRRLGSTESRVDVQNGTLVTRAVGETHRSASTLTDEQVARIARLGAEIADLFGGPRDIEWALDGETLWILQARPITAALPMPDRAGKACASDLTGVGGSSGRATGPARVVLGPADFSRVMPGDIIICPSTDPSWTPLLQRAAGVVAERGGMLAHAAIVAREHGIPAVLGVADATTRVTDGATLTIDGHLGTITEE